MNFEGKKKMKILKNFYQSVRFLFIFLIFYYSVNLTFKWLLRCSSRVKNFCDCKIIDFFIYFLCIVVLAFKFKILVLTIVY